MLKTVPLERAVQPAMMRPEADGTATVVTIQYLRAVAAGLIVFHHAMAPPGVNSYYPRPFGEFGVDLFFVISGYIMWTTTMSGRRGPSSFWLARIVRIVPLYWLYTTMFVVIALILPQALFTPPGIDPIFVIKSYLFVPAVHPHFGGIAPVYTLGWTLNYEMFFYFIFGLTLFVAGRGARMALLTAALVMLVLTGSFASPPGPTLATYTNPLLLEFLAGVALAAVGPRLMRSHVSVGAVSILIGLSWLLQVNLSDGPPTRLVAYGIPATLIVAGALVFEPLARVQPSKLGLLLGDASYSIYLAHPFAQRSWYFAVGYLLTNIGTPATAVAYVVTAIVAGILGGVLSYLFLERPLLAVGHRLIGRRSLSRRTIVMETRP